MEKKQFVGVALIGIIVMAFLVFVTFKVTQIREVPGSGSGAGYVAEEENTTPVRRHGPKVKKKVNLAQTLTSDWGTSDQSWGDPPVEVEQEPPKDFSRQTPEEAVESVWQGLDTYREMSPEEQARTRMSMSFVTGLINMMGQTADSWMNNLSPEQREEALESARNLIENIDAVEAEVGPDMTDEERELIGTTLDALRNTSLTMLDISQN